MVMGSAKLKLSQAGKLFPEWQAEHNNDDPAILPQLKTMYNMYGKLPGKICKNCLQLKHIDYNAGSYLKCGLTKWTHGPGTDWRAKWTACGKFEDKKPVKSL
jgi:hypothetical protein